MVKLFKNMSNKELLLAITVVALTCVQTFLDLTLPDYMSQITMLVQTQGSAMGDIYAAGFAMVLCALGSLAISVVVAVIAAKIASNFSYITRSKLFSKVMGFSMAEMNKFSTPGLITRTTNDITQVQLFIVMGMQMLIKAPITAVWAIVKIAGKNSSWTIATGVAVVILLAIVGVCLALAVPRFKRLQSLTDNINRVSKESLDGLNVVRAYNAEQYQSDKFEKANAELTGTNLFTVRTMSFLMPSIQMISSALVLAVYLIGAVIINEAVGTQKMTLFSDMVVFSSYAMQVLIAFMMLVFVFMLFPRASVSSKRINEVLGTKGTITSGKCTQPADNMRGMIEFKNVSFKYPGADDYVLKNISFTAEPGQTVAFIGSTGCGKSTAINLIPRFYDANEGEVLVGGVNVKEYDKKTLNAMLGYVSQRAVLFTGTVESNVGFGAEDAPRETVERSVDTAQASEFVSSLEDKYKAHVAQGGRNFSGGQKQRISIARAIFKNPDIFIFDDSFSALDYKTDRELRETLQERCAGATMLIVAQRIGTIKNADKIIVLEEGEIVGMGAHTVLLEECEVYKQIALSQLSEEELKHA